MVDIARHPLLKQAHDVCQAIEACGASLELTAAVTQASALLHALGKHLAPTIELQELVARDARTLLNAFAIADGAARSDVELYAKGRMHPDGFPIYDLREAECTGGVSTEAERLVWAQTAQRAAAYIRLRGDVWPWVMLAVDGEQNLVRFVEKEPA